MFGLYINADLSKPEARTAYDQRCRRRMAAMQRLSLNLSDYASNVDTEINYGHQHHRDN